MLELACKARMPMIGIRTEDVMYLPEVLEAILGKRPEKLLGEDQIKSVTAGVYYLSESTTASLKNLTTIHKIALAKEATLILANPKIRHPTIFDIGAVHPPKEMVGKLLSEMTDKSNVDELIMSLGGCGLKSTSNYVMLTMARDGSLTPSGITKTRRQFFQLSKGVTQLSTEQQFYDPDRQLKTIVDSERDFFLHSADKRLRMRGLLMDGPAGTGKTEGAKWLARQWGLPLFRLDIAGVQNKYVGESQRFLQMALQQAEAESPCVLLVDEVEKVMKSNTSDSSGTKDDMLSQLLWWLAEHDARILTVMTTNNKNKIPPELIRKGRIDEHLYIEGLKQEDAPAFIEKMLETFDVTFDSPEDQMEFVAAVTAGAYKNVEGDRLPQAVIQATLVKGLKKVFKNVIKSKKGTKK